MLIVLPMHCGLIAGVGSSRHGQLGLDVSGDCHNNSQRGQIEAKKWDEFGLAQVHPQETAVERDERSDAESGVNAARQVQQAKRRSGERVDNGLVQSDDDRELDQSRQTGAKGVDAFFFIDTHLFLRQFLLVFGIFFLNGLPVFVILQFLHGLRAFQLLRIERPGDGADDNGEQDDRPAKCAGHICNQGINP